MKGAIVPSEDLRTDTKGAIGVGSLIIFIAMILVAGITASVLIQTMNNLQQQALQTSEETLRDISSGVKVSTVSGYVSGSKITQLALFITPISASDPIDLTYAYFSLSDSSKKVILNYTSVCFNETVKNSTFNTLNSSKLSATTYGLLVVRDVDDSCTQTTPVINERDLVILLVNTTKCFQGISTSTEVAGEINLEYGISGMVGFTTPSAFIDTIVDLQP